MTTAALTQSTLDTLPTGTQVVDEHGDVWTKLRTGRWSVRLPSGVVYLHCASFELHGRSWARET